MYKGDKVTAIVTAAGKGLRMGTDIPKQFLKIGGKTVLEKAIEPFQEADFVDAIIVVAGEDFVPMCEELCGRFSKVTSVIQGGKERQDSVKNAIDMIDDGLVLIHDGARPYVTVSIIEGVIEKACESGAAVAAVPAKDTMRKSEGQASVTLDRSTLYNVQTPQGFRTELIKEAFAQAYSEGFYGTDDAMLAERIGANVAIAEGSYGNIKITTKEDLPKEMRIGTGFDVHRLTDGRPLIICGVEIPFEKGLLGHSDADVATHALMDAMLGAAAMGDIGKYFPDSDEQYKGISSMVLLSKVGELIKQAGYTLGNGDITIMAQRPKMLPHIETMRKNISNALGVDIDKISIKATTTEKLGFVGREEGIAAEAVCILNGI